MDDKFRSRKFLLACLVLISSIVALFTGHLVEQSYLVLVGGVLGLYGYQNLKDDK